MRSGVADPDAIVAAYVKDKKSLRLIAEEFGSNTRSVTRILAARGIHRRPRGQSKLGFQPKGSRVDSDTVVDAYTNAGTTIRKIAEEQGRSYTTIRLALIAAGVQFRPRPRPRVVLDPDKVIAAYVDDGWSLRQIAARWHCERSQVRALLVEAGIEIRRPSGWTMDTMDLGRACRKRVRVRPIRPVEEV